ncbi:MAG: carboxypeptidase regulatory-like domain-containing protein [Nannocystaceae bacterium]|nr:carboxypeptidase regulatory-like domain-containing protein [Nannocystaceae bacterium]
MKKLLVAISVLLAIAGYAALRGPETEARPVASASGSDDTAGVRVQSRARPETSPTGLSGTVRAADGSAVVGAAISVIDAAGSPALLQADGEPGPAAVVRASVAGHWRLEDLSPGTYSVIATARGHLPARSKSVALGAGQTLSGLDVELTRGGQTVTGTVTDAGGGPVEGAVVRALGPASAIYGTLTDTDGSYALTIAAGSYDVEARDPDYQRQTHRLTIGGSDRVLDFKLIPGAAIFGTVLARTTGKPVRGATISFDRKFRSGSGFASGRSRDDERVTTDEHGNFALRQLRAAEYELHATADHAASRAPTTVSVGIAEQEEGTIILVDPAFNVAGRVVDRTDPSIGIANVDIEAFGFGGLVSVESRTGDDGSFLLEGLAAGSYPLTTRGGDVIVSGGTSVEVVAADVAETVVAVERGTRLVGRVEPSTVAIVKLEVPDDARGRRSRDLSQKVRGAVSQTSPDGAFELGSVPVGQWTLVAVATDGSWGELEIEVPEGGLTDPLLIHMKERPSISGRIVAGDGEPVLGATLTVVKYTEGASVAELFFMSRSPVKATSDAMGSFALVRARRPRSGRLSAHREGPPRRCARRDGRRCIPAHRRR